MENKKEEKDNIKNRISEIDNNLDDSHKKMKEINEMHEELTALSKNINRCIELLTISIKGPNVERRLNDLLVRNQKSYSRFSSVLDEEMILTNREINKLNEERDNLIEQDKQRRKEE